MAASLWELATSNAFSTTLNGSISDSDTTITLTTTSGLVFPGVICIDREDSNNVATPSVREYISYTGISGSNLTGCTRGLGGSTAQAHNSGAKAEEVFTITHWNDLIDFLQTSHDASGDIVTSGTASIATLDGSIGIFDTHLNVSGASITGNFPLYPTWLFSVGASAATTNYGSPAAFPQSGAFKFFSATLNGAASGADVVLDINKNGSSIFHSGTRLTVAAGGTYASTASINTKVFSAGDVFSVDVDGIGNTINDIKVTVTGRG